MESGVSRRKRLWFWLIVIVVIILVVVGSIMIAIKIRQDTEELNNNTYVEEKISMEQAAAEDCDGLQYIYSSGAVSESEINAMYDRKIAEYNNDSYTIALTICYANYMHYKGVDFEQTLAMLEEIEPLIKDDADAIEYYDRLVVYYVEREDGEKAKYYADLRDELMMVEDAEEYDGEDMEEKE